MRKEPISALSPDEWSKVKKLPNGFWNFRSTRLKYLRWLGRQLDFRKVDDWYRVTAADFQQHNGGSLLTLQYRGSPQSAVKELYPNYDWKPWKFDHVPNGWWKSSINRKEFVLDLQNELGIVNLDDWYDVSKETYLDYGGRQLFSYLDGMIEILREVYPDHVWYEWLLKKGAQRGFFAAKRNRVRYLKWLESVLGWRDPSDWFEIPVDERLPGSRPGRLSTPGRFRPVGRTKRTVRPRPNNGGKLLPMSKDYPLPASKVEVARLRMQSDLFREDAASMLDRIGVQAGWRCLDLCCGVHCTNLPCKLAEAQVLELKRTVTN